MQVEKQNINLGKAVFDGTIMTEAEGSMIVPDTKADILKVLQVDAETFICDKQIVNGKVTINGKVNVNVLYVPESESGYIECISGSFDFCETLRRSEFDDDMQIIALCDNQKVTYRLINSRKIAVMAKIEIGLSVIGRESCTFLCDAFDECAELKKEKIELQSTDNIYDFNFKIEESLDFASVKNGVSNILKCSSEISEKEYKVLSDKIVTKGKINICVLYLDSENCCAHNEFEIPFTEVFEIDGIKEDTECELFYQIGDTKISKEQSQGEDSGCFLVYSEVAVCVKTIKKEEAVFIKDIYFTNAESNIVTENIKTDTVCDTINFSTVVKEIVQKEENMPNILSVYQAVAKPYISATEKKNDKISVSGKIILYILYMSTNKESPLCSINEEIPFNYVIDTVEETSDAQLFLDSECEHLSYTLASENAVEIRSGIKIFGKLIKKTEMSLIKDVEITSQMEKESMVLVYFVKKGDTLWDISRKYKIKSSEIAEYNSILGEDALQEGQKLLIPIKR